MLNIVQIYGEVDFSGCLADARLFYRLEMEAGLKIGVISHVLIQTLRQFMSWQEVLPGPYLSAPSCNFPSSHCTFHRRLPTDSFISEDSISQSPHCQRNKPLLR